MLIGDRFGDGSGTDDRPRGLYEVVGLSFLGSIGTITLGARCIALEAERQVTQVWWSLAGAGLCAVMIPLSVLWYRRARRMRDRNGEPPQWELVAMVGVSLATGAAGMALGCL
jgi:hypothetical protein